MADPARDIEDAYPLTRLQSGMFFHSQQDAGRSTYHDLSSLRVTGPFRAEALTSVLAALGAAHEVLRSGVDLTTFSEPMQLVRASAAIPLTVEDLTGLAEAERDARVARWRAEETARGFDLSRAPLLRVHVQRLTDQEFWLHLSFHHAILDGWSLSLFTSRLLAEYDAALGGATPRVPRPGTRFRDYVLLERKALADESARDYWAALLADTDSCDPPRWPDEAGDEGRSAALHPVPLPAHAARGVREVADRAGVPPKAVMFAVHVAVLARLTGQRRVVTGRIANSRPETEDGDRMVGLFLNVVPLVVETGGADWLELARRVHRAETEALPFRRYPLSQMLRDAGRETPFGTLVDYREMRSYGKLAHRRIAVADADFFEQTNFGLSANYGADVTSGELRLRLNHDTSTYSAARVAEIGAHYADAFAALIEDPEAPVGDAFAAQDAALARALADWSDTATALPAERTLPGLLAARADGVADRVAVRSGPHALTYRRLHASVDALAGRLRERGIGPGAVVGVHLPRSPALLVALLAVMRAGGAYLPLDPEYPAERLAYTLADSGAALVLADTERPVAGDATPVLRLGPEPWPAAPAPPDLPPVAPEDLAYVIYTSGSTGRPKGVQIPHEALVNLLLSMSDEVGLTAGDRWLALTSLSFDIAGLEVFAPLLAGAELVLSPDGAADGGRVLEELRNSGATIVQATPSSWRLLLEAGLGEEPGVRGICGGEALPAALADQLAGRLGALWNAYGPTETTIWSCLDRIRVGEAVTIGRPLANTGVRVLDERLRPVPVGVPGELYLAGEGLARGYRGRPGLTSGRFVADPSGEAGRRVFRTGDTVRWRPDGRLEFLGRSDDQVKIRGYRIELGEIETVLGEHPAVDQAVVVTRRDERGGDRLVAYLVGDERGEATRAPAALRAFAAGRLPAHMLPSAFVALEAFPLTPNGKVDRRALPDPGREHVGAGPFVAPLTETERLLARLWAEELGLDRVGTADTFRDLGGHSIAALRIALRVREATGVEVPIAGLLTGGTVASLAAGIDGGGRFEGSVLVPLRERGGRTPYFLVHPLGGSVFCYAALTEALPEDQPVYAFQVADLAGGEGPESIEAMAGLYLRELRAVQPHGPYRLGGWCLGGVVAYEMARRLADEGERIEILAVVSSSIEDPVPPEYAVDESAAVLGAFGDHLPITREELRAVEPELRLPHVLALARGDLARPDVGGERDLARLVRVFQRHARAVLAYRDTARAPYPGALLVVRAADEEYGSAHLGWAGRVSGPLVLLDSPGRHSGVMTAAHAGELAARLRAVEASGRAGLDRFGASEWSDGE
ncbi:amino acid adenylation domain-containing protein [Streptomyces zhaozhouensis]|uniref:Amino acid adenylation domain-containing protein n=2 Tax=Streptomyces zhaozhouensis TaxID=1300267 RepID=A0A286DLA7_9ACTN|nr:amino acid adenylation domain-containing protein [Streptomyces zhaozhouensis]